jgi:hypothetical protein
MKDMGMDMPGMEGMNMSGRGVDPSAEQNASSRLGGSANAATATSTNGKTRRRHG